MDQLLDILEGCKSNDRKSQEKLYYQFYPGLFTLCRKFFADEHEVLSVLNNGMIRVFKNIGQYDPRKGSLFNWAYTVVRNTCLTMLREKNHESLVEYKETLPEIWASDPFEDSDWEDIFYYLEKLPPATRAVCSLFYLEGFSIKEISGETGMKEGTVKWHLNESRTRLRDIFEKSKER